MNGSQHCYKRMTNFLTPWLVAKQNICPVEPPTAINLQLRTGAAPIHFGTCNHIIQYILYIIYILYVYKSLGLCTYIYIESSRNHIHHWEWYLEDTVMEVPLGQTLSKPKHCFCRISVTWASMKASQTLDASKRTHCHWTQPGALESCPTNKVCML